MVSREANSVQFHFDCLFRVLLFGKILKLKSEECPDSENYLSYLISFVASQRGRKQEKHGLEKKKNKLQSEFMVSHWAAMSGDK